MSKRKYTKPEDVITTDIASHGVIVTLTIGVPGLLRQDKAASAAAATAMLADQSKAGSYTKALLDMKADTVQGFRKAMRQARDRHYENSLPWDDSGRRFVPHKNYETYCEQLQAAELEFEKAKRAFLKEYPKLKAEAKKHLGAMYDESQYLSVGELEGMFKFSTLFEPVPTGQNFTVVDGQFPPEAIAQFQKGVDERVRTTVADGVDELMNEAYDRIKIIADRLDNFDPENKDAECRRLREALFTNLTEMCRLLPKLNVLNDPRVETLIEMTKDQVLRFDVATLRASKAARDKASAGAKDVMATMEGWSSK